MSANTTAPPVLVGGTGRSGTTVTGRMIGYSDRYEFIPVEIRFHTDRYGLSDLANGRATFDQFKSALENQWFYREPVSPTRPRGLHVLMAREALDEPLERLRATYEGEPWCAAGQFLRDLLDPVAMSAEKAGWVETTPPNSRKIHDLSRMLPEAKFIHMVRDGRDVASSVIPMSWGPNDFESALKWWSNGLIEIENARKSAESPSTFTMRLESFAGQTRNTAYRRLAEFLSLGDDPSMKAYFDKEVTAEKTHGGRWKRGLKNQRIAEIQEMYDEHLVKLRDSGVSLPQCG